MSKVRGLLLLLAAVAVSIPVVHATAVDVYVDLLHLIAGSG